jgi:hypothetical protein
MNCANHPDAPAVAYCRTCGKPLCSACVHDIRGVVYCEECLAAHVGAAMPPPASAMMPPMVEPPKGGPNPIMAAVLGFIPGVGAMYNGEFAKGFIHVLIFATLIWMTDHINGIFGLGIAAFVIYMPIEAYKTAQARQLGLPSPDPMGINSWFSSGPRANRPAEVAVAVAPVDANAATIPPPVEPVAPVAEKTCSRVPVGAFILIGLGVLFLLDEMGALHFDWIWRFWPLILIAIGIRILMQRQRRGW